MSRTNFSKDKFITNCEKLYLHTHNYEMPICFLIGIKKAFNNSKLSLENATFMDFCNDMYDFILANEEYDGLVDFVYDELIDKYLKLDYKQIKEILEF